MRKRIFHRSETGLFSGHQCNLADQSDALLPFLNRKFSKDAFADQIREKSSQFTPEDRKRLQTALRKQYEGIDSNEAVQKNIDALSRERTWTVTTGHQLTLLCGPLFFVEKILDVIRMAEELAKAYPDETFVPVFWMASEDHDFEEIQTIRIFNQTFSADFASTGGPVGRFNTEHIAAIRDRILGLFREEQREEIDPLLASYQGTNLAQATRNFVEHLFGRFGLVIVDGDDAELKSSFACTMKQELDTSFVQKSVESTNKELEAIGVSPQVFVRDVNLFYIRDNNRVRIQKSSEGFTADGVNDWSKEEMEQLVGSSPESVSPNALMRPLYQETVLPNLCYVGGAGELNYWLQLKRVFEEAGVVYPLIKVRNSIMWIDSPTEKKLGKLGADLAEAFQDTEEWKKSFLAKNAGDQLDHSGLDALLERFRRELGEVLGDDPGTLNYRESEVRRFEKQLEGIKTKIVREAKARHDQSMKHIESVRDRLFPDGGLQERSVHLLSICADGGVARRINGIHRCIEPFQSDLIAIVETEEINGSN